MARQSFLEDLLKNVQGSVAQVNPWDNGATYRSVVDAHESDKRMAQSRQRDARTQQYNQRNGIQPSRPQQGPQLYPGTASGRDIDYTRGPVPQNTPFRMFEDGTFEGNPNMLKDLPQYQGYTFYEDNSFSAPRPHPQNIQYEDGSGIMNGQRYGAMDSPGDVPMPRQQQDPLAQLRQLLGF